MEIIVYAQIIDAIQSGHLQKTVLVREGNAFFIMAQTCNRKPTPLRANMRYEEMMTAWKAFLVQSFMLITLNRASSEQLAAKRLRQLC